MDTLLKWFNLSLVIMTILMTTVRPREEEVCLWDTFEAACADNEVIQMELAHYGRMSVGRCIPQRAGYDMGCMEDVLSYLDSICSGRQSCQLRLPDEYLDTGHQPCPLGLHSYLQLQYNCTPVHISATACAGDPIPVAGIHNLLANEITGRTGKGSLDCPWEIRGSPGQKIRLTMIDYGQWSPPTSQEAGPEGEGSGVRLPERSDLCHIYARLTEESYKTSIILCGGETKEKVVYISETEKVHIAITDPKHSQHPGYFLLRYEITGCPSYIPPEGAVINRHENDISVVCPDIGSEWHMFCDGKRWQTTGNSTNCTVPGEPSVSVDAQLGSGLTLPQGILLISIISIAVLIAVIILVVGIVSLRRRRDTYDRSGLNPRMDTLPSGYSCKEFVPILTSQQRAQQERGYMSPTHRHTAGNPAAIPAHGKFPPLPPPPTATYLDDGHCTVHTTSRNERNPQYRNHSSLMRPCTEHILESPQFLQNTDSKSGTKDHFYYELDPEHTNFGIRPPLNQAQLDTETCGQDSLSSNFPDILSTSSYGPSNVDNV